MNELEDFIVDLNLIQKESLNSVDKHEKLAEYLFTGSGWTLLKSINDQTVQVNAIFGEKLNDLLIDTCSKLLIYLSTESKFNFSDDLANINDHSLLFNLSTEMVQFPNESGSLFHFIIICLNLYIRFNDGTNNNILYSRNKILVKFCEILFDKNNQFLKLIYLKFLKKLFKLNFDSMLKKTLIRQYPTLDQTNTQIIYSLNNLN